MRVVGMIFEKGEGSRKKKKIVQSVGKIRRNRKGGKVVELILHGDGKIMLMLFF